MGDKNQSPLACDMAAIPADQRPLHLAASRELFAQIEENREISNGYEFRFTDAPNLIKKLADFVALERLCCPFLRFELHIEEENGPVWLRLSGREGVKEFIREEIGSLIGFTSFA